MRYENYPAGRMIQSVRNTSLAVNIGLKPQGRVYKISHAQEIKIL
jgi:hypothetical protein